MDKVIVFKNPDGSCGIVVPTPEMFDKNSRSRKALEAAGIKFKNEADVLNWIAKKDVPSGLPWRITTRDNIPADRTFRAAWTDDNTTETVDVHMDKARDIHMGRIREKRNDRLKALDVHFQRAIETDDKAEMQRIAAAKQKLRDLPANIDLATIKTPDELAAFLPPDLANPA